MACQAAADSEVHDASLQSLSALWAAAQLLPEVPDLPYLLSQFGIEGGNSRGKEGELVAYEHDGSGCGPLDPHT